MAAPSTAVKMFASACKIGMIGCSTVLMSDIKMLISGVIADMIRFRIGSTSEIMRFRIGVSSDTIIFRIGVSMLRIWISIGSTA